jgi:hypothetical protein
MVCTQRKKGNAKSQGILNVSTSYICKESRLILLNANTLSASWTVSVIALLYTLSTHQHPSFSYYYFSLHFNLNKSHFFFLFQKLSYKASILLLFMHNTPTRKVISSLQCWYIFAEQQKSK